MLTSMNHMTDISGRFRSASMTGDAFMKFGRAPTTQRIFIPSLSSPATLELSGLADELAS